MNEFLISQCIAATTNLMERPIFKLFKDRLYFEYMYPQYKSKKSSSFTDLDTILSKLQSNSYETKDEWVNDIATIWSFINSILDVNIVKAIGNEFEKTSRKIINNIVDTKEERIKMQMSKLLKRLNNLSKTCPN